MTTTTNGTAISSLQLCSIDPVDLDGAKAALGSVAALTGVHQRVTVRSYGHSRRAAIRTLVVRTDPDGHMEIHAVSGTYRFLVVGGGTAELILNSAAGTLVDIIDAADITISTSDVSFEVTARTGTVSIATTAEARGVIDIGPAARCTVSGNGSHLQITRSAAPRTGVVQAPDDLAAELIARIPADPWGRYPRRHHEGRR